MNNWLFEILTGEMEGELFFVQEETLAQAKKTMRREFPNRETTWAVNKKPFTDEEAEMLGYDTF